MTKDAGVSAYDSDPLWCRLLPSPSDNNHRQTYRQTYIWQQQVPEVFQRRVRGPQHRLLRVGTELDLCLRYDFVLSPERKSARKSKIQMTA